MFISHTKRPRASAKSPPTDPASNSSPPDAFPPPGVDHPTPPGNLSPAPLISDREMDWEDDYWDWRNQQSDYARVKQGGWS